MARVDDVGAREFYVVFVGSGGIENPKLIEDNPGPYDRYLDREFRHVFLITSAGDRQTLIIDPLAHAINHKFKPIPIGVVIRKVKSLEGTRIIKYNRPITRKRSWRFRGIYNCVTLAKAVLNIWCWSITPKQFYKYLLRSGGIIIKG